ncbi:MAG TPA: PKD domain-containing protein [Gemmatimonadales bacterium]
MQSTRRGLGPALVFGSVLLSLGACGADTASPPDRVDAAADKLSTDEPGNLAPLDLVYVCGNKFLATNSNRTSVHLTWRVLNSSETGSLTLPPGPLEDPGHSETEVETEKKGVLELSRDGDPVVRRRNLNRPCGAHAIANVMAAATAAEAGSWTEPFPWPSVAIHLSLLPTGKILSWGLLGPPVVWDPASGAFTEVPSQAELFCSGHSLLPDGRVLVSGGHIASDRGIPDISIFSPGSGEWTRSAPMRRGRWYPTNTTLPNGSVLITAGRDEVGDEVAEPEVWSPGGIRQLTGASLVLPYYPRTFVAPDGRVFYAGELQTTRYLNFSGNGSWATVGSRRYGARPYGAAVMYELGKILYVGGGRTTNTAETIDLNAASPTWQWTGSMAFARRNLNATILPTGEVLVTGGSSAAAFNDVSRAIHVAEMWNPGTGLFTTMASNAVSRTYHSTSLLLPDGRVLHTGSGEGADMPEERNAELYSPPYLSKGPRPTMSDAPDLVGWGTSFNVQTPDAADVAKVSLIRLGSVTHSFDMNQRLLWLGFTRQAGGLTITAPASGAHAPPGHYMLFLVNQNGVPSVGKIVKVSALSDPSPGPNAPPAAAFLAGCGGLNCSFADKSADPDGNLSEWRWEFGDGEISTARDPSHAYVLSGSYSVRLTAKDQEGANGTTTRQVTVPGPTYPLGLTLTTSSTSTQQRVTLSWTRAQGTQVYIYRNGLVFQSTANDGSEAINKNATGPATYIFKVCEAATTICSNPATAQFNGGAAPDNAPPNAMFTPTCASGACRFADGSTDPDGTVSSWQWNFGDGTSSTQRNPSHTFASAGTYDVRLTVTDDRGGQGTSMKQVTAEDPPNAPPTADLTWTCTGLDCSFTDASSDNDGSITAWAWTLGDGETSDVANPSHTYGAEGTYTVSLAVTDDEGAPSAPVSKQVTVRLPGSNVNPVAAFTSSCTDLTCNFTDQSTDEDGRVALWSWSFGDGTTSAAQNPSRTYASGGTYSVTLVVTDDEGGTQQHSASVTVAAPPPPPPPSSITLAASGFTSLTKHSIRYNWSGAVGAKVDLYRNGVKVVSTANDGHQVTGFDAKGTATYAVKVCQAGSTTICSPTRSVTLGN